MRSFHDRFESFCCKHPRLGIKNLMLYIVIGNLIVYIFSIMDRTQVIYSFLAFSPTLILKGQVWRIITYIFAPATTYGLGIDTLFFAIMLYFYYMIGSALEREWGAAKLTVFYFSGVLLTAAFALILGTGAGTTYINLSLFLAFATLYPDARVLILYIIPVKVKYLGYIAFGIQMLFVILGFRSFPANLLPLMALLNYFFYFYPHFARVFSFNKKRVSPKVVSFNHAKRKAKQQAVKRDYTHKCEVCGRTDRENPSLEFRYCSRCSGYHCYCMEHINNHVHKT